MNTRELILKLLSKSNDPLTAKIIAKELTEKLLKGERT